MPSSGRYPYFPADLCLLELATSLPLPPALLIKAGRVFSTFWSNQRIRWYFRNREVIYIWPEDRKQLFVQDGAVHHMLHAYDIPIAPFMRQGSEARYMLDWSRCYSTVQFAAVYDHAMLHPTDNDEIPIANIIWAWGPHDLQSYLPLPMSLWLAGFKDVVQAIKGFDWSECEGQVQAKQVEALLKCLNEKRIEIPLECQGGTHRVSLHICTPAKKNHAELLSFAKEITDGKDVTDGCIIDFLKKDSCFREYIHEYPDMPVAPPLVLNKSMPAPFKYMNLSTEFSRNKRVGKREAIDDRSDWNWVTRKRHRRHAKDDGDDMDVDW